jgi:hypothetical protein
LKRESGIEISYCIQSKREGESSFDSGVWGQGAALLEYCCKRIAMKLH